MQLTACILISVIVSVTSDSLPANSDSKNTRCSISDDVDGTVQDLENKTTWTVMDATEGTVLIQFPFLNSSVKGGYSGCPKCYELTLRVKDGQNVLDHSKHTIWITNKEPNVFCDKMANVTFTHVYSGTYELRIHVGNYCLFDPTILIKNITTSYKKKTFKADGSVGLIKPQHSLKEMKFTVNVDTSMSYTLKYTNSCKSDCKETSSSRPTCQWKVIYGGQRSYNNCVIDGCHRILGVKEICNWEVKYPRENDTKTSFCGGTVKGDYSEGNTYDIIVQNVSTGCYCITTLHLDSRERKGVWRNSCRHAHSPFIYVKPSEDRIPEYPIETSSPVLLIVILCIALLCSPVIMWILWKYLRGRVPKSEMADNPYCNNLKDIEKFPNAEILLLYPRDCEPFMKLMKQFKELLKTTCKCQVLDYYDQEHSAEIDREGSTWLLKKINSPATNIILVESICSVLNQEAHFGGITIKPTIQHSRDNFFTLALVELTSNKHTVFVIRFNNNMNEEVSFKCISRGVRYIMPYQLKKLITAMGFCISEDVVQIDKGMEMALINNINGFISYANENKDYIMDLYKKC